ncbi:MAG TPA: glutamate--cysteine ligase [Acidimicrobiales bacterium]|jgi:carboxylate-amine ligase|nr:glutamate--cysteine ligase [Acidimicrobiales bacterium]
MADEYTVGVEEEFCIVDAGSGQLRTSADAVVRQAKARLGSQAEPELHRSQVETGTTICHSLGEVRAELERLRREVRDAAAEVGCAVLAAGTHPTATSAESSVNPGKERYRRLEREYQAVAREQLVNGCHVHVGIADRDLAIDALNRTRPWLATVLALSANSPFWAGADTGYASYRTEVWTRWPLTGMPEPLTSRAEFDALIDALKAVEALPDATFLYWDVRPSARYETLEFRVADACLGVDDAVMVAGLWRALARTCATEAASGPPATKVRNELVQAARWRAARYGLEGTLVDVEARRTAPAAEVVDGLLSHLRPALEAQGDWDEVRALVEQTTARGNGATRQRAALARRGELGDVVDLLRL